MAVSIASPLMPPVESPIIMNESKDEISVDTADSKCETENNADSPNECPEKPTNGDGDLSGADADDDSRKLFVGGLSWETTKNDLKDYFSRWGTVKQCIIKLDRFTGNSRGFGFVTMESEECVSKVLSVTEHWLRNKKIDPKKAKPSREPLRKVFVGGIDPDVTEDQIREYFSIFGKVESLDLPFDANKGKRKHYIFVSFSTEAAARKAIAKDRQEIFGRQCDVRVAITREQANKQKVMRHCWFGPAYAYPTYNCEEFANAYTGFEPFGYNYYGYNFCNNAVAAAAAAAVANGYGAYPGLASNQFRSLTSGTKPTQCQRNSTGTIGGVNSNRLVATGAAPGSLSNHHSQQNPSHTNMSFNLLNPQLDHPPSLSTGLDFSGPPPSQTGPGMVAGAATGYPHP